MVWPIVIAIIALIAITVAMSFLLKPKTQNQTAQTVDYPKVEEGKGIPVIFGTMWVDDPMPVWFGDVKTVAVRKKGGKK